MVSVGLHRWSLWVSAGHLCGSSLQVVSADGLCGSPWVSMGGGGDD